MTEVTLNVKTKMEDLRKEIKTAFGDVNLGGGNLGLAGKLGAIAGGILLLVKAISDLKPIKMILDMVGRIVQLFLLPFAMMALQLLKPVLIWLLKIMPSWYKALSPVISKAGEVGEDIATGLEAEWDFQQFIQDEIEGMLTGDTDETLSGFLFGLLQDKIRGFLGIEEEESGETFPEMIKRKILEEITELGTLGIDIYNALIGENGILTTAWNDLKDIGKDLKEALLSEDGYLIQSLKSLETFGSDLLDWIWSKIKELNPFDNGDSDSGGESNLSKAVDAFQAVGEAVQDVVIKGVDLFKGATGMQDGIITPSGEVIKTAPDDYIIATKTPRSMGGTNITINVSGSADDEVINKLTRQLRHEMSAYGRF